MDAVRVAVKPQVWIALSVYVLVAIINKGLKIDASLLTSSTDSTLMGCRPRDPG